MTDNNENGISLEKFFSDLSEDQEVLKDQLTPEQKREFEQRMDVVAERFLFLMRDLKKETDQISNRDSSLELETRQVNITLPASAWAVVENIRDMFEIQRDMGDAFPMSPEHRRTLEFFREKTNDSPMDEVLISQTVLEAFFAFASMMAEAEIGRRISEAIATEDPGTIKRTLQFIASALTGELPEKE